jgi:hypothetical protein
LAAQQHSGEPRNRHRQQQQIEAVFVGFCRRLQNFRHTRWERRQISEEMPPDETHDRDEPYQHAAGPMQPQKCYSELGFVADCLERPYARKLDNDQEHGQPVQHDAGLIEPVIAWRDRDDRFFR